MKKVACLLIRPSLFVPTSVGLSPLKEKSEQFRSIATLGAQTIT